MRFLLHGVVLADVPNPTQLIAGVFNPATLLARVHRLFGNLAGAASPSRSPTSSSAFLKHLDSTSIGLQVGVVDRFELLSGDVMLWLENDDAGSRRVGRGVAAHPDGRRPVRRLPANHAAAALQAQPGRQRPRPARGQVLRPAARRRHHTGIDRAACLCGHRGQRREERRRAAAVLQPRRLGLGRAGRERHRARHHARHRARHRPSRRSRRRWRSRCTTAARRRCRCAPATAPGRGGSPSRRASARSTSSRSASARPCRRAGWNASRC